MAKTEAGKAVEKLVRAAEKAVKVGQEVKDALARLKELKEKPR